ncbi:hypothetical protein BBMN23_1575 [Bifidobacterium adolescentis]|jgi:hypothetical protein|uniref:HNH endonuclease n=1 Tax=Bifidobacterium adolescentis TaxID=1680 RepID=UPI0005857ABE|nr:MULTISPECIES: HNH endonuclease [Bifidobacterium]AJE06547.1 hypothetical protein BBMN23_1575 [Bifidobacterium adolescentis]
MAQSKGRSKVNPRRSNGAARRRIKQRWLAIEQPPICRFCHRPIDIMLKWPDPWSFTINEIKPVSKGGSPFQFDNTEPMHLHCNSKLKDHPKQYFEESAGKTGKKPVPVSRLPITKSQDW